MKFLILAKYGTYSIEAEDIAQAADIAYDSHTAYNDVLAIVVSDDNWGWIKGIIKKLLRLSFERR